jgi:hypothetical protein
MNDNGDLLADYHVIFNRWKHYFSQLLNVHSVSDIWQTEVHMTEPLVPNPSRTEVQIAIVKLKKYKLPIRIPAGGKTILRSISTLILFQIGKKCQIRARKLLLH